MMPPPGCEAYHTAACVCAPAITMGASVGAVVERRENAGALRPAARLDGYAASSCWRCTVLHNQAVGVGCASEAPFAYVDGQRKAAMIVTAHSTRRLTGWLLANVWKLDDGTMYGSCIEGETPVSS